MPGRNPWVGWGTSTKLRLGLGAGVSIHPLLTGVSDGFHVLKVYLTSSVAKQADAQPVEVRGGFPLSSVGCGLSLGRIIISWFTWQ